MGRTLLKVGLVVAGLALVLGGGAALAERSFGPRAMHRHMTEFINGALDAAKADPAQRSAIEAAEQRAITAVKGIDQQRRGEIGEAIALFGADTLDGAKVQAMKTERLADMTRAGDAIVAALTEAHGVLRPDQRALVADYIRAHKPQRGAGSRVGAGMMKHMVSSRLDDMLDKVDASEVQRTAIEAARDYVFSAFEQNLATAQEDLAERALTLFQADKLDPAQVQSLRSEHQARAARIADAVVQAIHDVHDALTPAQRKIVTDEIQAHVSRFEHHRHGGGSGSSAPTAEPSSVDE